MSPCTVAALCAAVGGKLLSGDSAAVVTGVTTDSRAASDGQLFIPLTGERFDGHAYIDGALSAGAAGCLTARVPETMQPGKFYIQVADTRLALKALAAWYRSRFTLPVVQITGSAGKTTTKEMVAAVLSRRYDTLKTQANFNNDIGTPLTLLGLAPQHQAAVIETGMNHFGEIRYLGEMVRPDIAVITNVGDAHIENLGNTRQGILQAKCEIFENLAPDGIAVLNGDDPLLDTVTLPQTILRCGRGEGCSVRVTDVDDRGIEGMILAAKYAREHKVPYFGICLGMQVAVCEFARNVVGLAGASSSEFDPDGPFSVIDLMSSQEDVTEKGGTMRLGAYPCKLAADTLAREAYGEELVYERHRHRFEFNNAFRDQLEGAGLVISGLSPDERLVEMVELPRDVHPWFVATQAHPEFKSRPTNPQPLFREFVRASIGQHEGVDRLQVTPMNRATD